MIDTGSVRQRFQKLREDILHAGGVQTSQTQNYPFSIFVYAPVEEYDVRTEFSTLKREIERRAFRVLEVNLADILLNYFRTHTEEFDLEYVISKEKESFVSSQDARRNLAILNDQFGRAIGDQEGICRMVNEKIKDFSAAMGDTQKVVFITRSGFLYPYLRTSALLNFLQIPAGLPVIILYPGERVGDTALRFMGVKPPDANYRPRIY